MELELAKITDAQQICDLLNLAYRGDKGWTTENSIVDGDRSTISDIKRSFETSIFLTHTVKGNLISCICLEVKNQEVYIGSFAVHPSNQEDGLGKTVLDAAEKYAIQKLKAIKFIMVVLSKREELISFYERRGYNRTGIKEKYPSNLNIGSPKTNDLTIEQLYKIV